MSFSAKVTLVWLKFVLKDLYSVSVVFKAYLVLHCSIYDK
jgi:hypothetical protein